MARSNILVCFLMIIQMILGITAQRFQTQLAEMFPALMTAGGLIVANQVISVLLPVLAFMFFAAKTEDGKQVDLVDFLRIKPISGENILLIAAMCIFIQPLMAFLSLAAQLVFSNNVGQVATDMVGQLPYLQMIVLLAVFPAVFEELALRGAVLSSYNGLDERRIILINGLFFGMVHLDGQQLLYAIALGAFFAFIVLRTGSLFAGIIAHFTINASQVSLAYYLINTIERYMPSEETIAAMETGTEALPEDVAALGIAVMVTGMIISVTLALLSYKVFIWLLRRFSHNNPPPCDSADYCCAQISDVASDYELAAKESDNAESTYYEAYELGRLKDAIERTKTLSAWFYITFLTVITVYMAIMASLGSSPGQLIFLLGIFSAFFFVLFFLRVRS